MLTKKTTRVSAHVARVLDASTFAATVGEGASTFAATVGEGARVVAVASHAEPDQLGVVAEMAAQVASSEPTTTQSLVTVEYLTRLAEMAAQVASSEPTATQALDTVDHAGAAAEMAAHVASVEPAATQVLAIAVEMVGVAAVVAAVHD